MPQHPRKHAPFRPLLYVGAFFCALTQAAAADRFIVYYGEQATPGAFNGYGVIVLDADRHPPLAEMPHAALVFGYISLGEVANTRANYAAARKAGLALGANPDWPGSFYVDLRKPAWQRMVLDDLVPGVLAQGFGGLFIDTLDDAATLEAADPRRHAGMVQAAGDLVHALHLRFPNVPLLLNRAYEIQPRAAPDLWGVLGESVLSNYVFTDKRYTKRKPDDVRWQLDRLRASRAANPALHLFTLDYWNPNDSAEIRRLYAQERGFGNVPYVATIDLQHIIPEPTP